MNKRDERMRYVEEKREDRKRRRKGKGKAFDLGQVVCGKVNSCALEPVPLPAGIDLHGKSVALRKEGGK
jgi:hypothetical protein